MARKRSYSGGGASGSEDSAALVSAYQAGLNDYASSLGTLSASNMVMALGGDKSALARRLAGLPETGRLPETGTKERTSYNTQYRSITKWLAYESGERGGQTRNVARSKATQAKFRGIYVQANPPRGRMTASITGRICFSNDCRERTIDIPPRSASRGEINTPAFLAALASNNAHEGYRILSAAYAPGMTVERADNIEINFEQE